MRKLLSSAMLFTLTMTAAAPMLRGQEPPLPTRTKPQPGAPIISSRQIDRYDAISNLQQRLKENPKSLADWIILGELAHEVALDLPADQASRYYRMSRDAYEKALAIEPNHPGLKAAIQFAKDHETNAQRFEEVRDRATQTYLEARRRDLAATRYTPSLPVYGAPLVRDSPAAVPVNPTIETTTANTSAPDLAAPTAPPVAPVLPPNRSDLTPDRAGAAAIVAADRDPAETNSPAVQRDTANMGTRQFYSFSYPTYQAYYAQGAPYTYQQYSSAYYPYGVSPANIPGVGAANIPATLPITPQRYYQQVPLYPGLQSGTPIR